MKEPPTYRWMKELFSWVTNDLQVKKLLHHVKTTMWRKLLYHEKTDGGKSYIPWVTNDIQVT
jgi:hypothetical protein